MQTCEMPLVAKRLRGRTKERGSGGLATKVTAISGRCAFMGAGWTGTVKGSRMPLGCARMTPGRVAEDASVLSTPRLFWEGIHPTGACLLMILSRTERRHRVSFAKQSKLSGVRVGTCATNWTVCLPSAGADSSSTNRRPRFRGPSWLSGPSPGCRPCIASSRPRR